MTRLRPSLSPPPDELRRLADFPQAKLGPETTLWRAASKGRGPWWFGSSMAGRFDLPEPEGTCYLATDELTAVLEVFGPERSHGMITTETLARKRLHRLRVPHPHSLADLTARRAAGFGLTLEAHSHPRYDLTQAWARSLSRTGADGLRYFARHDPSAGACVALFGPSGERRAWESGRQTKLDTARLVDRLWQECRIRIADRPRTDQIPVFG